MNFELIPTIFVAWWLLTGDLNASLIANFKFWETFLFYLLPNL